MDLQKLSLGQLSSPSSSSPARAAATSSSSWFKVVHKVFNQSSSSSSTPATVTVFNPALITAQLQSADAVITSGSGGGGSSRDGSWEAIQRIATAMPRRMCGDWSPKLKLLRYVTKMPSLLFHFASDYSHQGSGYKAKVYIENGK